MARKESEGLTATTVTKSRTPTIPVTLDTFQDRRGSESLPATRTGLGFKVTVPRLIRNERMGLGTIDKDHIIK